MVNEHKIEAGTEDNILAESILRQERVIMKKEVMILTGAGQIGMAIARRMGHGMKILIGDKKIENAQTTAKIMKEAGFDTEAMEMTFLPESPLKNF